MSVGKVFALLLAAAALMYAGLQLTLKRPPHDGIVRLRWSTDDNPARREQLAAFKAMYPGVEVNVDAGDWNKLIVQCATRTGSDILDVYSVAEMATYVQAGILEDLTPWAATMGFGVDKTYPALAGALTLDEAAGKRQFRFPCNVWANCVVYNTCVFDELGIPRPTAAWTYDDFIRISKLIIERSGGKRLAVAHWNNVWLFKDLLIGYGGRFFSPDGLTSRLDSPESCASARLYYEMMHVHKVLPTPAEVLSMTSQGGWGAGGINWFTGGKAAMIIVGRWFSVQVVNYPDLIPCIGAVTLPHVGDRPSAGIIDARAAGVNRLGPHKAEAMRFLQFLASKEYSDKIAADGDAQPPRAGAYTTGAQLAAVNAVKSADFHQAFIDALANARPMDVSPFMDAGPLERWLKERMDAIDNLDPAHPASTPEEIMRGLAAEINHQIRINLERRPELRRRFREITGREWTADWWRTER